MFQAHLSFRSLYFQYYLVDLYYYRLEKSIDNKSMVVFIVKNKYYETLEFQCSSLLINGKKYDDIIMSDPVQGITTHYIDAIIELANLYRRGYCTEKNIDESIKWYEIAISKGHIESMLNLAELYTELGDTQKAIHYYKKAAESGNESAILKLGQIYEEGIGIPKEHNTAVFWYRKAAANGNEDAKKKLKQLGSNWIEDGKVEDGSDESENYDIDDSDLLPF